MIPDFDKDNLVDVVVNRRGHNAPNGNGAYCERQGRVKDCTWILTHTLRVGRSSLAYSPQDNPRRKYNDLHPPRWRAYRCMPTTTLDRRGLYR